MNRDFEMNRAPQTQLRAERAPRTDNAGHIRGVDATSGGLLRSGLIASAAAAAMLTIVYLPAEYGIDATGFGAVLGLTEMGQIKQQLYAEAEAEDAAAGNALVTLDPDTLARLARIEAQMLNISAVIGAPTAQSEASVEPVAAAPVPEAAPEPATAPEAVSETALETGPAETDAALETAIAEASSDWRDEVSYTLAPGEGIEVKLVMLEGQTARFFWTANGAVVNYDTHGDGSGQKVSYEQGRDVPEQAGELTAAFTGNHGWFWRNRSEAPVTVTLRAAGAYAEIKAP